MSKSPDPFEQIAPLIGHVTIAWNNLQFWIFCVFWKLLAAGATKADSIFFALRTDKAQRDITLQIIKAAMFESDELRSQLEDLIEKANKLSGRRNDVIHAMIFVDHPDAAAQVFASSSPRLSKKKDLLAELQDLVATIKALNLQFALAVNELDERERPQPEYSNALSGLGLLIAPPPTPVEQSAKQDTATEEHNPQD